MNRISANCGQVKMQFGKNWCTLRSHLQSANPMIYREHRIDTSGAAFTASGFITQSDESGNALPLNINYNKSVTLKHRAILSVAAMIPSTSSAVRPIGRFIWEFFYENKWWRFYSNNHDAGDNNNNNRSHNGALENAHQNALLRSPVLQVNVWRPVTPDQCHWQCSCQWASTRNMATTMASWSFVTCAKPSASIYHERPSDNGH